MLDLAQLDKGKYKTCLKINWAQMEAVGRKKILIEVFFIELNGLSTCLAATIGVKKGVSSMLILSKASAFPSSLAFSCCFFSLNLLAASSPFSRER